ncbi:MAG: glycosyltransferase [Cyanobacteria bacterium P01_F01_bin.53]
MSLKTLPSDLLPHFSRPFSDRKKRVGLQTGKGLILGVTLFFFLYDGFLLSAYVSPITQQLYRHWPYSLAFLVFCLVRCFASRYPSKPLLCVLLVLVAGFQIQYLAWRIENTLFFTWGNSIFMLGLLAFEFLSVFNSWVSNGLLLFSTNCSQQADRYRYKIRTGQYRPTVDIFIPTYNEPVEVLRRTIIGCQSIKYSRKHKRIWLLDDGDRAEMRQLADVLGCDYLARPEHIHAKAGNLNYALQHTGGDIVVVFDADFVPLNTFLERTLGFFGEDPNTAMVVTPQHFYNPDPPQKNLGGHFIPGDQTTFYHIVQPARDAVNAVVCSGSSIVYRRSALNAIGGIPTDSIVEDYVTGILLQSRGFKTHYINEVLSVGAAANTIGEYIKQRARWAEGTLKTIRSQYNPLRVEGFSVMQRFVYLTGVLYWIEEILKLVSYFTPILYFLFGIQSFSLIFDDNTAIGFFCYAIVMMTISWVRGSLLLLSIYTILQGFHVFRVAFGVFLRPQGKLKFEVTSKRLSDIKVHLNLRTMRFVVLLLGLTMLSMVVGLWQGGTIANGTGLLYVFWAQVNAVLLATALVAGVSTARDRGYPRVNCDVNCLITREDGTQYSGSMVDISEAGTGLKVNEPVKFVQNETVKIEMPDISIRVKARIRHPGKITGCLFIDPIADSTPTSKSKTLWKLINFSYCRPSHWRRPDIATEWQTIRAIVAGLYQLHPFSKRK